MDIEAVSWFAEVIQAGSFAGAARRLGQPSSNVSRRIAKLEQSLGYKLLLRTTRRLVLTDEGKQLLPMANQINEVQQKVTEWRDSQQAEPSGQLRMTAPGSFARGPLTTWTISFCQRYPKVVTEVISSNDYLDFQEHQLDVAFRQGPLPSSGLVATRLFSIEYGVFASPEWLEKHRAIHQPSDLLEHTVVACGAKSQAIPWRFSCESWQPKNIALLFEDFAQCLQAATEGLGVTYASRYDAIAWLERGELVEILGDFKTKPSEFYIVTPERQYRSLRTAAFIEHIQQEVDKFGYPEGLIR